MARGAGKMDLVLHRSVAFPRNTITRESDLNQI